MCACVRCIALMLQAYLEAGRAEEGVSLARDWYTTPTNFPEPILLIDARLMVQLNRKKEAFVYSHFIAFIQLKIRRRLLRPFHEQLHRRHLAQSFQSGQPLRIREFEGWDA